MNWQKNAPDDGSVAENFFPSAKFLVSKRIYFFVPYCNARASRRKLVKPADFSCAAGFSRRFLHSLNRTAQCVARCDWQLKGIRVHLCHPWLNCFSENAIGVSVTFRP
jgi:hypothetical protein